MCCSISARKSGCDASSRSNVSRVRRSSRQSDTASTLAERAPPRTTDSSPK
jgi:hypothetical protein